MKVKINEVIRESSKNLVTYTTEYGSSKGIWIGDAPEIGKEYFVEYEIEDNLIWGDNVKKVEEEQCAIGIEGETLYIIGYLESVEDDGYTVIRLGESIISLVVEGQPFDIGVFVKIEVNELALYDVNY